MIRVDLREGHLYELLKDALIWHIERAGRVWIKTALKHKLLKIKVKVA